MPARYRTVEAAGLEFGLFEQGSGPLALCLHGFPDTAHTWRHLLPALADAGFHAVAPFLRGYAPSALPADGAYQTGALVADACALHDVLGGGDDAVVVGHDWGAFAAYGAAANASQRWRRVVTLAVPPPPTVMAMFADYAQLKRSFYIFLFQTDLAEGLVGGDGMPFLDGLWRDWSPGYDPSEDLAHVKESLRAPENLSAAIGYYRAMLDPSRHLPRYADEQAATGQPPPQPTLYLHGRDDGCLGADLVAGSERDLSASSRAEVIDGVGHFLHLERPDEINAKIIDWVNS